MLKSRDLLPSLSIERRCEPVKQTVQSAYDRCRTRFPLGGGGSQEDNFCYEKSCRETRHLNLDDDITGDGRKVVIRLAAMRTYI